MDNTTQKKPRKALRVLSIFLVILVVIIIVATIVIGNFFVNYALVPNQGGENRDPWAEESVDGADSNIGVQSLSSRTRELAEEEANIWLAATEHLREERTIVTADNLTLHGHAHMQEIPTKNWVVLVHGYQADEASTYKTAYKYYEAGYNVLTYNHRAIAPSEGKYITMGIKESDDLIVWLNSIIADTPDAEIVVHGTSMGAATTLMPTGKDTFPSQVIAVIADCSYSSIWGVFSSELDHRFQLGEFPFLHMAGVVAIPRVGINLMSAEGDVVEYVKESTTPTLFIHGTWDDFVPFEMVYDLHDAMEGAEKDLFVVAGAGHADSEFTQSILYWDRVFEFVEGVK